jgi:hypothetical protein
MGAQLQECRMKTEVPRIEERQFITREFADTIGGRQPPPYFRLHDPVQKALVEYAAGGMEKQTGVSEYCDRMIHFWREVSLAGMQRAGTAVDECYALLFESAFDLAEVESTWVLGVLAEKSAAELPTGALNALAGHSAYGMITHAELVRAFTCIHAPLRETDQNWYNEVCIPFRGESWFWSAVFLAAGMDENHPLWSFRCAVSDASASGWRDNGYLHLRLIREAPTRALATPRIELMAHPILRIARLKYREGSVEQAQVLRFLNAQCIRQGFESEEDYFGSDLALGQWARDARQWASNMLEADPETCRELFHEAGETALDRTRMFYLQHLGSNPSDVDSLDATAKLMKWANQRRGFHYSQYRAQRWEFVVEIADAAVWLGWLFPVDRPH